MNFGAINLLTWKKRFSQRVAAYVLSVFMLQIIAAGFCISTASAAHVSGATQQNVAKPHCMATTMKSEMLSSHESGMNDKKTVSHVCVHCDLPDLSFAADKLATTMDHGSVIFVFVSLLLPTQAINVADFSNLSPPLRTSLFSFDLNQRFRV